MVSICVMCRGDVETCKHLFSFCAFTRSLTSILLANFNFTVSDELDTLITNKNIAQKIREIILIAHFIIWREMCFRIFKGEEKSMNSLLEEIRIKVA
jgi:hypothetical protein